MAMNRDAWESHGRPAGWRGLHPASALRQTMLWASRRQSIKRAVMAAPVTSGLVRRFVAGEAVSDAVAVTRTLSARGLQVTLDHLGEDTRDAAAARNAVNVYRTLITRLDEEGLTPAAEVSLKLSAVGQALDESMSFEHAASVCETARAARTTVTIDMEDHTTTDATLRVVQRLRQDYPSTGVVIQASLHRTPDDSLALSHPGSRVRLCKGAYQEPAAVAWQSRAEVRSAFLRCLRVLLDGGAYPMVATHDPRLVEASRRMIATRGSEGSGHELQFLYGIRTDEQMRLAAAGERVRIYVPFGTQWYGYLMRRMAERPANLALVLRAVSGG